MIQKHTIGIIGTGNVGIAAAYALFLNRTAGEIILIDKDNQRAEGEAMDLMHGQPYVGHISIRAGDYSDLTRAQVVVVSAGVSQRPGENRLELLNRNADVLRQISAQLDRYAPEAILLVASNPVDVLTYTLQQMSKRPNNRVIGTGTMLAADFAPFLDSTIMSILDPCTPTLSVNMVTVKCPCGAAPTSVVFPL